MLLDCCRSSAKATQLFLLCSQLLCVYPHTDNGPKLIHAICEKPTRRTECGWQPGKVRYEKSCTHRLRRLYISGDIYSRAYVVPGWGYSTATRSHSLNPEGHDRANCR